MTPLIRIEAPALVLFEDRIDTDVLFPARFLLLMEKAGLGQYLCYDRRFDADGKPLANPVDPAIAAGARIYSNTPALDYARHDGRWRVRTGGGTVRARALVLATNAYTGEFASALAPALAREMVPVVSWQMATQPMSEAIRKTVLPGRQALSDTHGELYFARFDARQRLISGGAVVLPFNRPERLRRAVAARLQRLWPQLGEVHIDPVWNGYVGMTSDFMPRFHRLGPDAWGWVGCNGRAVGLAVALGGEFAKAVCGTPESELALPFTDPAPLPLHGIARKVAPLMLLRYRRMDRREI